MSELPKGWTESTLGEACVRASKVNPKDEPEKEITYLDIGGIDNEALRIVKTKTYTGAEAPSRARQLVKEGDVLFSTVRTYLRKIAQVPVQYDGGVASTGFTVLRGSQALDPKYLFYYVTQNAFIKPLSKIQRGTSYPAVRNSDVFEQPITLAPLPEQRRIVARIEELFSRLDAGVAALRHAKAQLQRYRQSVLAAAVTGQLTQAWREQHPDTEPAAQLLERMLEQRRKHWNGRGAYKELTSCEDRELPNLPKSWVWGTTTQIFNEIKDGTHDTPKYQESGIPFITQKHIKPQGFVFEDYKCISQADHDHFFTRSNPESGDILISMIGVNRGQSCIVPATEVFSIKNVGLFKPHRDLTDVKFLQTAVSSLPSQQRLLKKSKGGAQPFVGLNELRNWALPLPPLAEQQQIAAEVEARATAIEYLEADLDHQVTRSNRLRQSILFTAFSGRLVSQDPSDEPAKALLGRIRTLEKQMPKKKTPRKKVAKKRAIGVRNKDELIALLEQLGGSATPERLLVESKLENNIDAFFELIREASVDKLIDAPIGKFGEISLPQS